MSPRITRAEPDLLAGSRLGNSPEHVQDGTENSPVCTEIQNTDVAPIVAANWMFEKDEARLSGRRRGRQAIGQRCHP